jgi:hypothetical protein
MLTVMGDQDNTIRTLSIILGRDHNDQDLHDMHNELFGGMLGQSGTGGEGMDLVGILSKLTTFIQEQVFCSSSTTLTILLFLHILIRAPCFRTSVGTLIT